MGREIVVQNVEELHQTSRDVLRQRELALEGHLVANPPHPLRPQRGRKRAPRRGLPHPEEPRRQGIQLRVVVLAELAVRVDEHPSLLRQFRPIVIPNRIMPEVVKDLQRQEEAGGMHVGVPVEDRLVDDLHMAQMPPRMERVLQILHLEFRQRRRDLNDLELGPLIHLVVGIADEIEDIQHQRAVARPHLVDDQIVVRVECQLVVRHQISRDRLAVVRLEQLRGRVPQLPRIIGLDLIEPILELGVPLAQQPVERWAVLDVVEVERLAGTEDSRVLGEIAVMRIVKTVCKHTTHKPRHQLQLLQKDRICVSNRQ